MLHIIETEPRYDAVIVGARCAGAATAMLLARAGMRVLAVDRQPYGSDTLSTHALMRPAVMQLSRWGLLDTLIASGAPLVASTTFHYGPEQVTVPIRSEPGLPGLIAPRRTVLDRTLVDAARAAGATILHDTAVDDVVLDARGRVRGISLHDPAGRSRMVAAGIVVGADGLGSFVARKVAAATLTEGNSPMAHVFHYAPAPAMAGYHWYFGDRFGGGVIPTNDGLACIVASMPTERFDREVRSDLAGALRTLAVLAPELAPAVQVEPGKRVKAFRGSPGRLRQAYGPGWLLVGDAGFFRDPVTSHGISDALRDAEGAALAILSGREQALREFQDLRDGIARPILETTDAIASCDWSFDDLPHRHKRFSEAMKAEIAVLSARAQADGKAAPPIRSAAVC